MRTIFGLVTFLSNIFFSAKVIIGGLTSVGATWLGVRAGTSSNDAAVGGVLYVTATDVGRPGTTSEDTLASYTVPANTLAVNLQSLWFEAHGVFSFAVAGTKTLRVYFGSTVIFDLSLSTGVTLWSVKGRIYRLGSTSLKSCVDFERSNTGGTSHQQSITETLSSAVALSITGEGNNADDVVVRGFIVGWDDANT